MPKPAKPTGTGALNTLNHCLSAEQWRAALAAATSQRSRAEPQHDQRAQGQPRHHAIRRCLLRVDRGGSAPGIYLVRSRDISHGGLCVIHGGPLKPDTLCCVIIESNAGQSLAAGGSVAWCNPVKGTDPPAYELGIRFYEPIDASPFAGLDQDTHDAA
jgi:PilZ domain